MCDLCFLQEHKGHFSQDEGVKKFITIKNEYDKTISQIKKIKRTIEEKKNDIITKINEIENKLQQINQNNEGLAIEEIKKVKMAFMERERPKKHRIKEEE